MCLDQVTCTREGSWAERPPMFPQAEGSHVSAGLIVMAVLLLLVSLLLIGGGLTFWFKKLR